MARNRTFEGKSLEEALHSAAEALGIAEPDLDYEIIEQGRPGLFGLGAKNVCIRVMPPVAEVLPTEPAAAPVSQQTANRQEGKEKPSRRRRSRSRSRNKRPAEPKPETEAATTGPTPPAAPEPPEEEIRNVEKTLGRIIELMGLEVEATGTPEKGGVCIRLDGPDTETLSAKDGELISSLQFLLNRMARRSWPAAGRIHLYCNGHPQATDEELIAKAKEVAAQVLGSGRSRRLAPMNAYERRLIHLTIREFSELGSRSEGEGYLKRVQVYKQQRGARRRRGSRRRGRRSS